MHIILIGFMGAGKTTVGRTLSKETGISLFDTDLLIETRAGMRVSKIFEISGEEEFRRLETETVRELADTSGDWVLSTGGGLPLKEENRRLLRQAGTVVYLRVRPETVIRRLKGDTSRPLLSGEDVRDRVRALLESRSPVYESTAHLTVDVDEKSPVEICREILCKKRLKIQNI